eukprot:TRINITY_DN80987_c0_g1_i1.p1 TRINITY_DN80987_c0_g1~~TRINITY_DN80987_c0_g1_i1.p1  ORF type:complete len:781 (+),score=186.17 TRINITY_DN80987_c0_g1_i1:178-2520(+)
MSGGDVSKDQRRPGAGRPGGLHAYDGELASSILLEDGDCAPGGSGDSVRQPLYQPFGSSPASLGLDTSILAGAAAVGVGSGAGRSPPGGGLLDVPAQRAERPSPTSRGLDFTRRGNSDAPNRTPTRTPSPVYQWNHPKKVDVDEEPNAAAGLKSFRDQALPGDKSSSSTSRGNADPQAVVGGPTSGMPFMTPLMNAYPWNIPQATAATQAYYGLMMNNALAGGPQPSMAAFAAQMQASAQQAAAAAAAAANASSSATMPGAVGSASKQVGAPGAGSLPPEMMQVVHAMQAPRMAVDAAAQDHAGPGVATDAPKGDMGPRPARVGALGVAPQGAAPGGHGAAGDNRRSRKGGGKGDSGKGHADGGNGRSPDGGGRGPAAAGAVQGGKGDRGDRRRRGGADAEEKGGGGGGAGAGANNKPRPPDRGPPASNALIEQLKARDKNVELSDLAANIAEIAQDQYGSRLIQQKLEVASEEEKQLAFKCVLQKMNLLTTDVFGNYVIQKFFEYGSSDQRRILAEHLFGQVLKLSMQMYGCRVVQKALDSVPIEQQVLLVGELKGHVLKCIEDQHGNHVIQKCIERLPTDRINFVVESFEGQANRMAKHCYGCRVIQRLIEYCSSAQISTLLEEVLRHSMELATDQYGNYVIQHIMEHSSRAGDRAAVLLMVRKNILTLSCHKYASNVIEKALSCSTPEERAQIIDAIAGPMDDPHPPLLTMMRDRFGNYIVQRSIALAQGPQRDALMWKLGEQMPALKKSNTYGKHIISALERAQAAMLQERAVQPH